MPRIQRAGARTVNVLTDRQLSTQFAHSGDKFDGARWRHGRTTEAPVLENCCLVLECEIYSVNRAGGHSLVLGQVHEYHVASSAPLLIFHRGDYAKLLATSTMSELSA